MNLFNQLENISELIPTDFGGGSPLSKTYLMAYLILRNNLKTFVEIGVYRGKSLFPVTYAIKQNKGTSFGIDPYNKDDAREFDIEKNLQKQIDEFIDDLDFENMYQDVTKLKSELGFDDYLELIRNKSSDSVEFFRKNNIGIDMLHIDGNHDTKFVTEDVNLFLPLLTPNGIVVMDDIDWDSVKPAYEKLKEITTLIFESNTFAILINCKIPKKLVKEYEFELSSTFNIIESLNESLLLKNNAIINDLNVINNLEAIIAKNAESINKSEALIAENTNKITNLEANLKYMHNEQSKKDKKILELKSDIVSINNRLLTKDKEIHDLELNINTLFRSRKRDIYKNFQILFSEYSVKKQIPKRGKLAQLSNIPYLFILLKSKGNIKKALQDIKGYNAIKRLGLFDQHYYLNKYKNVLISGMNPLIHYLYYGSNENKFPNALFNGEYYLNKYEEVKASGMNPLVHYSLYGINKGNKINDLKISVIITSYNHEKYIRECIDSILMQRNIDFELIIGDDHSDDKTKKIIEEYQMLYPEIIKLIPSSENMGITKNLKRCLEVVTGDYVAICEGDDYWTDPYKLQKQAYFLESKKGFALCFNAVSVIYEDKPGKNYYAHKNLKKNSFTTRDLIQDNLIGNFSCCMYRTAVIKKLPDFLYDIFTVDWMFNMACSEYGKIGFINESMSVYRKHNNAYWSSKDSLYKKKEILKNIDIYNKFFSYRYDEEFVKLKKRFSNEGYRYSKPVDVIVFDDVFPHPLSAFRFQEYNSYLEYFNSLNVYSSGQSLKALNETKPIENVIENYEKNFPKFKNKVRKYDSKTIFQTKMIYTIFLNNIYSIINQINKYHIPFVFTLYPGGGLYLKDEISDKKMSKVFSSPFFRKVIVTQKITYDYLLENNFCKANQIEYIFGGVAPLKLLEKEFGNNKKFGRDKSVLDICFVAQKYTEKGEDKGYDVFIDTAHILAKKYDNIQFHVVGGFDENVIDVSRIKDKIHFYGLKLYDWFDEFYKDKDIILSPNVPFKLKEGAFDGFPTGCCTDAGLHKVAIFCTDELNLNTKFNDQEDIVIIPHDSKKIVEIIDEYYKDPIKLQSIGQKGCLKIKEIYNYDNQIAPRIKILEEIIKEIKKF